MTKNILNDRRYNKMSKNIVASLIQSANDLDEMNLIKYADEITDIAVKIAQIDDNTMKKYKENLDDQEERIQENIETNNQNTEDYNKRLDQIRRDKAELARKEKMKQLQNSEEISPIQTTNYINPNIPQFLV